eukprot:GFUD01018088.1.p1 GENE.GFUD01018088.1~~GFUD01018088.1.p1  ORF type:complete len:658 (-),score=152.47 GFUD01018088.1:847-2820(-)
MSLTTTIPPMHIPATRPDIQLTGMEGLCARWILKQKSHPATGTTFPPFSHNLPYFKERLSHSLDLRCKCKCLSEPDLSPEYQDESLHQESSGDNHDEDYLFEFDIGSPDSDEGSSDLESEFDSNTVINVIEGESLSVSGRRFSVSSDASSSCSHRKEFEGQSDGFSTIFGSISSGLGSERRNSHGNEFDDEDERLEGLSVEPDGWKENCALYLGTKMGSDSSLRSSEGCATPILAASPQVDSPIVSPDSCLDEENLLEDQNLCIECATSHSFQATHDTLDTPTNTVLTEVSQETSKVILSESAIGIETLESQNYSEEVRQPISENNNDESIIDLKINVSSPEPEKVEINSNLHVSTDKLNILLGQLEADKLYPNQDRDDQEENDNGLESSPNPVHHDSASERPKLRKCSSLKTGRSPPQTPGCRKFVRFADILGLDLSEVKVFLDEIPRIPKAAFDDLDVNFSDYEVGSPAKKTSLPASFPQLAPTTSLVPMFNQPGRSPLFFETVLDRKVCLENAFMDGPMAVFGLVRVLNISFHKAVTVKWTVNDWSTANETVCEYVLGSSSGNTDKFSFKLETTSLPVGNRLQFCLKYDCAGEHWDNNEGSNYVFQVFLNSNKGVPRARSQPIITSRNHPKRFSLAHQSQSPSQHGDDPWLRFM